MLSNRARVEAVLRAHPGLTPEEISIEAGLAKGSVGSTLYAYKYSVFANEGIRWCLVGQEFPPLKEALSLEDQLAAILHRVGAAKLTDLADMIKRPHLEVFKLLKSARFDRQCDGSYWLARRPNTEPMMSDVPGKARRRSATSIGCEE